MGPDKSFPAPTTVDAPVEQNKESTKMNEQSKNTEAEDQFRKSIQDISRMDIIKVSDKAGKYIFSGNQEQLMTFWKNRDYGAIEDIGGISDQEGKSVLRFGAADGRGFTSRTRIEGLFQQLGQKNEIKNRSTEDQEKLSAIREQIGLPNTSELSPQDKVALKQELVDTQLEIFNKRRETLQEDSFMMAQGINPDTMEKYDQVDGKIGQFFDAHGIAKSDQLEKLLGILQSGIDPSKRFFSAPFEVPADMKAAGSVTGTAGGTAYKDGIAVMTSGYKESLVKDGIKHVFVNDIYAELKQPLAKLFPQYKFHLLTEQKQVMEEEARLAGKK